MVGHHVSIILNRLLAAEPLHRAQILWLTAFLSFFFLRASIMLFVLRLLPIYKKWQKHTILICFGVNIAITLISCISYGLSCVPFRAWYENVPGSTCFSKHKLVITNQVNASKCRRYRRLKGTVLTDYG